MPKQSDKSFQIGLPEIRFFRRHGYLVVEDLFTNDWCDHFASLLKTHAEPDFPAIMNIDRDRVPEARLLMSDSRLVKILDTLQDYEVVALMSQVLFKEAGSRYANQGWNPHQDNTYCRTPYGAYITINVFLTEADPENGGLYIFPGSHVEPLLPAPPTVSFREASGSNPGNPVEVPAEYKKVDLCVKKGSLLVLHGHVIHGSYPNLSTTRSRPLFSASYTTRWANRPGIDFRVGRNAKPMVIEVH